MALLLFKEYKCAKLFWNICLNTEEMPSQAQFKTILSFDLQVCPWSLTFPNKCFKCHYYSSRRTPVQNYFKSTHNVEVMAPTSSVYDHFIIWPSSVTLTFSLTKQIFQMTLLFLKENTCEKLFWNPYINIGVMAQKTHLWLFYHLIFKCDLDLQLT